MADTLVTDLVKIEQARARLKTPYLPKFKKAPSSKKGARFCQLENKMDIAVLSELADQILLAR